MSTATRDRIHKNSVGYIIGGDQAQGIIEAIVNVFGIIDTQADIIHNGAYSKTIKERGSQIRVKVLDNHRTESVTDIVAKALDIHEVSRAELPAQIQADYPKATGGLYAKMQFMLDDDKSAAVFKRIDFGAANEYSIGLEIMEFNFTTEKDDTGRNVRVRNIKQLALFDVSPVIWGANEATATTDVKNAEVSEKAVTKFGDLPLATRERAWDAGAADKRVRTWAKAEDAPNAEYAKAFFWHDDDGADKFTSYKLGFADVIDGKLTAVPRGIFAVAGVLNGARGGVDIPDADKETVKAAVSKYYTKMAKAWNDESIVVPWQVEDVEGKDMGATSGAAGGFIANPEDDPSKDERAKRRGARPPIKRHAKKNGDDNGTVGSWMMSHMLDDNNDCAEEMLADGCLDLPGYQAVMNALIEAMQAFKSALPAEIADVPYPYDDDDYGSMWSMWGRETPADAKGDKVGKEGRRLSTSTQKTLDDIHKRISGAAGDLRTLIDDTGIEAEPFGSVGEEAAAGDKSKDKGRAGDNSTHPSADALRERLNKLQNVSIPQ